MKLFLNNFAAVALLILFATYGCRPKAAVAEEQLLAVDLSIEWINEKEYKPFHLQLTNDSLIFEATKGCDTLFYKQKLADDDRHAVHKAIASIGRELKDTSIVSEQSELWKMVVTNRGEVEDTIPAIGFRAFVNAILSVSPMQPDLSGKDYNFLPMKLTKSYYNRDNTWKKIEVRGEGCGFPHPYCDLIEVTPDSISFVYIEGYFDYLLSDRIKTHFNGEPIYSRYIQNLGEQWRVLSRKLNDRELDSISYIVKRIDLDSYTYGYQLCDDVLGCSIEIDGRTILYSYPYYLTYFPEQIDLIKYIESISPKKFARCGP